MPSTIEATDNALIAITAECRSTASAPADTAHFASAAAVGHWLMPGAPAAGNGSGGPAHVVAAVVPLAAPALAAHGGSGGSGGCIRY